MTRHNAHLNHTRDTAHHHAVTRALTHSTGSELGTIAMLHDPADAQHLRGIPAIGRGAAGGHIPGTRPDHLTWATDNPHPHRRRL